MVSIIKNQLLKHLSRFTKNLSADKINLSTFKGEGELTNLELNEDVLTELLELPCWLRLTKAWCNKVTFRITWTKLKNVPICLSLDEVDINVETCEELRPMSSNGASSPYGSPGKYSFIHKVIDGITVTVNTVNIAFNSPAFMATFQIQRITVESVTPKFTRMELPMTRLKNPEKGQLLIFKELQWQTVRIEAKSTKDNNLTPLRLLTNQARCRITIKKRLSDCFILGSRLVIILDDLLWVLTDSQLKAALHFVNSLSGLIQRATQITRKLKAARKLEELPEYQAQLAQEALQSVTVKPAKTSSRMFALYDVVETSYHFMSNQIVLHLCDDPGFGRSSHPNLREGGALQISIKRFQVDFYPYHLAKGDRKHWPTYNSSSVPHTMWQEQALASFKSKFMDLFDHNKTQHVPLSRMPKAENFSPNSANNENHKSPGTGYKDVKRRLEWQLNKLMTTSVVIRVDDFTVYRVTTSGKKQVLKEFLCGDRNRMSLPKDASIIHAEYIYYYYPSDTPFPLPAPKFYVQLNPVQVVFDRDTCLWLNCFFLNLCQSLMDSQSMDVNPSYTYIDVKIEAILPRINFESTAEYHNQRDRPKCLSIQVTRATVTNVRTLEHSSRADLAKCVDSFHMGSLFFGTDFPSRSEDFYVVTQKFIDHISAADDVRKIPKHLDISSLEVIDGQLTRDLFWTEARDVWCIVFDPVYGDFLGAQSDINKPIPFLDAVPITIWLHANLDPNSTIKDKCDKAGADIHALAYISNLVSVQLNHYQYLFLMRLADQATELATFVNIDSDKIFKKETNSSLAVGALIPQLEVTFVMPPQSPGKESSGGDGESFVPDFSSIDDITVGILRNSTRSIPQMENSCRFVSYSDNTTVLSQSLPVQSDTFVADTKSAANSGYVAPQALQSQQQRHPIQNNINVGLSSVRKGFTSLISSIDSALKQSPEDMSDTISVRSDASSDSEQIVMINFEEDVRGMDYMFYVQGMQEFERVEEASEVIEEASTLTSTSDHSLTSSCRRKDLVCVSTFKLTNVEFLQQSRGYSSSIKVQIGNILSEECSSIPWDEFQGKFSMRSRGWAEKPESSSLTSKVKARLDHTLALDTPNLLSQYDLTDKDNLRKAFTDCLTVEVKDLVLSLSMTTVTGLADFIEDEVISIPLPLKVSVDNVKIRLIEDRPPVNITSPGPVPIDLNIAKIYITRAEDGIFNITWRNPNQEPSYPSSNAHEIDHADAIALSNLMSEHDELKRKLLAFERISEENRSLRKAKEESDILRNHLKGAQDDISKLLEEKKRLLDELISMREQMSSNDRRKWNSKS